MVNEIIAYFPNGSVAFNATLPISPRVGEYFESAGMLFEITKVTYSATPGAMSRLTIKLGVVRKA